MVLSRHSPRWSLFYGTARIAGQQSHVSPILEGPGSTPERRVVASIASTKCVASVPSSETELTYAGSDLKIRPVGGRSLEPLPHQRRLREPVSRMTPNCNGPVTILTTVVPLLWDGTDSSFSQVCVAPLRGSGFDSRKESTKSYGREH